jgi:hypothetical protein
MNNRFSPLTASSQLSVIYRPIGELIPDPRNARTHPKRQIEQQSAVGEVLAERNVLNHFLRYQ